MCFKYNAKSITKREKLRHLACYSGIRQTLSLWVLSPTVHCFGSSGSVINCIRIWIRNSELSIRIHMVRYYFTKDPKKLQNYIYLLNNFLFRFTLFSVATCSGWVKNSMLGIRCLFDLYPGSRMENTDPDVKFYSYFRNLAWSPEI